MEISAPVVSSRQPCLIRRLAYVLTAITPALAAAAEQAPGQALEIRPRYVIEANVDADEHRVSAVSTVTVPATEADPPSDARFVLYANAIRGIERDGKPPLAIRSVRMDGKDAVWRVDGTELAVDLPGRKSRPFDLVIEFTAHLPSIRETAAGDGDAGGRDPGDSKCGNYGIFGYGDGMLSLGSFWYPQLMVRNGGKWAGFRKPGPGDLLHAQAGDFTVTFRGLPESATVVASGTGDGRTFKAEGVRDFAALIGRGLVCRSSDLSLGQRKIRVTAYAKRADRKHLPEVLEIAASALGTFDRRFGDYPFDGLKIVEAPLCGGSGGMEYSGVASIRSGCLRALGETGGGKGKDPDRREMEKWRRRSVELTLAHEIAHQWWAMGVGNDSLSHPFVDEALATWSSMLYFEDRYGAEDAGKFSDAVLKKPLLYMMERGVKDAPANLSTSEYLGMDQYGMVIYQKGALFYTELRKLTGDDAFFGGLREYYGKFRFRLAGPGDLRRILLARAPRHRAGIEGLYRKWIEEANGIGGVSGDRDGDAAGR